MPTDHQLDQLYGHLGRTFTSFEEAVQHAGDNPRARVYPVRDHVVRGRYELGDKVIVGYLVSIDPEPEKPKPKGYTGRPRTHV